MLPKKYAVEVKLSHELREKLLAWARNILQANGWDENFFGDAFSNESIAEDIKMFFEVECPFDLDPQYTEEDGDDWGDWEFGEWVTKFPIKCINRTPRHRDGKSRPYDYFTHKGEKFRVVWYHDGGTIINIQKTW